MLEALKIISLSLVGGIFFEILSYCLKSDFLDRFLDANLIILLVALLAINGATVSIVMSKLREISDEATVNFSSTILELKKSMNEQIILILLALIFHIMKNSPTIVSACKYSSKVLSSLLTAIFVYAIYLLYDTAKSGFILLDYENKNSK